MEVWWRSSGEMVQVGLRGLVEVRCGGRVEIGRKLPQCSNTKKMHPRSTQPSLCPPPPPRSLARVFERLEKPAECIASWQKAIE
ncbi:MAG: hypothetical protein SGPRY_012320, partial [Prymnesium sp.]